MALTNNEKQIRHKKLEALKKYGNDVLVQLIFMNSGISRPIEKTNEEIKAEIDSIVNLPSGWTEEDYNKLVLLWYRESSWNPNAVNKKSGACGIPQANPCSKASKGTDYRTNWRTQVRWGLNYIKKRYGSPSEAWSHSQRIGWY